MSPWAWVAWAAVAGLVGMLLSALVLGVRDAWRQAPVSQRPAEAPTPVRSEAQLDRLPVAIALVNAWGSKPRDVNDATWLAAHDAVLAVMPDVGDQLDRLLAAFRQEVEGAGGRPLGAMPCAMYGHRWVRVDSDVSLERCVRCNAFQGVA